MLDRFGTLQPSGMHLLSRVKRFIRGRVKAWGPQSSARKIWNKEFAEGSWDFIEHTAGDCIYSWIEKYAGQGNILDLGCGSGNTGNELRFDSYRRYVGVDISDVAVEKAILRTRQNGRSAKNQYFQGDICSYEPVGQFEVILFRESIWYIPRSRLKEVLDRNRKHLTSTGVFIIRMHDRFLLDDLVQLLKQNCHVLKEDAPNNAKDLVLALR